MPQAEIVVAAEHNRLPIRAAPARHSATPPTSPRDPASRARRSPDARPTAACRRRDPSSPAFPQSRRDRRRLWTVAFTSLRDSCCSFPDSRGLLPEIDVVDRQGIHQTRGGVCDRLASRGALARRPERTSSIGVRLDRHVAEAITQHRPMAVEDREGGLSWVIRKSAASSAANATAPLTATPAAAAADAFRNSRRDVSLRFCMDLDSPSVVPETSG